MGQRRLHHYHPTSVGARLRYQLDRDSQAYKDVYKQRTATERINSQAVEWKGMGSVVFVTWLSGQADSADVRRRWSGW